MRFTRDYDGPLVSRGKASHKQRIRKGVDPQLLELWTHERCPTTWSFSNEPRRTRSRWPSGRLPDVCGYAPRTASVDYADKLRTDSGKESRRAARIESGAVVVDDELGVDVASGSVADLADGAADVPHLVNGHFQWRLVGLVHSPDGVVHSRSVAHLDVAAEHVSHRVGLRERDQPVNGRTERSPVLDVETTRVGSVAGK